MKNSIPKVCKHMVEGSSVADKHLPTIDRIVVFDGRGWHPVYTLHALPGLRKIHAEWCVSNRRLRMWLVNRGVGPLRHYSPDITCERGSRLWRFA